jgi:hypothetical protein
MIIRNPLVLVCSTVLAACSGGAGTMDSIMSSWDGAPLDAVIAQWGYPEQEQTIAGHHIYRWFTTKNFAVPATTTATATRTGFIATTTGGGTITGQCVRTIEVDAQNVVTHWEWSGNNCPFTEFPAYTNWRRKL